MTFLGLIFSQRWSSRTEKGSMVISWRPQHEVYPSRAPAPDLLAFDGGRVIGRMFQMTRRGSKTCWYWTVMATGAGVLVDPPSGVEDGQDSAARCLVEAYERLMLSPTDRSLAVTQGVQFLPAGLKINQPHTGIGAAGGSAQPLQEPEK